jgi:hypothetical protein
MVDVCGSTHSGLLFQLFAASFRVVLRHESKHPITVDRLPHALYAFFDRLYGRARNEPAVLSYARYATQTIDGLASQLVNTNDHRGTINAPITQAIDG